jgi:hypothetical protein
MTFQDFKHSLHDLDRAQVLSSLGLQQRSTTMDKVLPALALLGTGVLVGVGVGLMLAPRPGRELREDLRLKLRRAAPDSTPEAVSQPDGVRLS